MEWLNKSNIMKRAYILLIAVITCLFLGAQEYTQKWNDFYGRYDIYNSKGTCIGYYKYNDFYKRWEYHEN